MHDLERKPVVRRLPKWSRRMFATGIVLHVLGLQGIFLHIVTLCGNGPNPVGIVLYMGVFLVLFSLVGMELACPITKQTHFLSNHRAAFPDTESTL